ncbi:MAG: DUF502 domain-containing protein [Sedimentisphaerales bacterium]|nr:DUF502 domain-containing protein [Sedimentisphaerales bacterium]
MRSPNTKRLKSYFLRGLAVLLPTLLTIWILVGVYTFIRQNVSNHINRGLVWVLVENKKSEAPNAAWLDSYEDDMRRIFITGPGQVVGFLIALVVVFAVGTLLASVVGRALWRVIEAFILNTPVLRRVYPYVKQVTDFVLTQEEKEKMFSRVVAVEYPRKGIWSIGFVTGSGLRRITESVQKEFLTVLVPNSPTPVTGYVIIVPREQTIALDLTIEEAFRFAISAGVIAPDNRRGTAVLPKAYAEPPQE